MPNHSPDLAILNLIRAAEPNEAERRQEGLIRALSAGEPAHARRIGGALLAAQVDFRIRISGQVPQGSRGL